MQKHQKYFAVTDETGRLLPYFIAVRHSTTVHEIHIQTVTLLFLKNIHIVSQVANGLIDEKVVKKGNEAVLR